MKNKMIIWGLVVVFVIVVLVVVSMNSKKGDGVGTNDASSEVGKVQDTGGVKTVVSQPGTGEGVKAGDTISVNYTGSLEDGSIFDSNTIPSFGHTQPFVFTVGSGQVIKGWDNGVIGMKVGEKRHLEIPPSQGYGESGAGGVIPPNATLIFDVELLTIE